MGGRWLERFLLLGKLDSFVWAILYSSRLKASAPREEIRQFFRHGGDHRSIMSDVSSTSKEPSATLAAKATYEMPEREIARVGRFRFHFLACVNRARSPNNSVQVEIKPSIKQTSGWKPLLPSSSHQPRRHRVKLWNLSGVV